MDKDQKLEASGLTVIEGGSSNVVDIGEKTTALAGSKQWASRIRRKAKDLSQTLDQGYMELARILYQVWDTPVDGDAQRGPIYTAWGYTSFKDYAEKELNIHGKKAERLRLIWHTLEIQLKDMDPALKERIANLGFSKVRELIRILTLRNAEQWVEMTEGMSYRQVRSAVIDEKRRLGIEEAALGAGDSDGDDDPDAEDNGSPPKMESTATQEVFKSKRFDFSASQLENVLLALQKAAAITGGERDGYLLDLICTDFIATNDVMGDDLDKRIRYLTKIERNLGLKLIAVDPQSKDVLYGIEALELAASGLE